MTKSCYIYLATPDDRRWYIENDASTGGAMVRIIKLQPTKNRHIVEGDL